MQKQPKISTEEAARRLEQAEKDRARTAKASPDSPVSAMPPIRPNHHDTALFSTIAFGLFAVVAYLLQSNGVLTVPWIPSLFGYAVSLGLFCWTFTKWNVPNTWSPWMRRTLLGACVILVGGAGLLGVTTQYRREHAPLAVAQKENHSTPVITTASPGVQHIATAAEIADELAKRTKGPHSSVMTPRAPMEPEWPGFKEKVDMVEFTIGGMSVGVRFEDLKKDKPPGLFNFGGHAPFVARIVDNKLRFSFHTWAGSSLPPVEVDDNEFKVRPLDWDRNSSLNAFEVVSANGFPVFQMIRKTPAHIVVNGIFITPAGIFWASENRTYGASPTPPGGFYLRPIFRYPSWKYPGVYADQ